MRVSPDGDVRRNLSMGEYLTETYRQTSRALTCSAQDEPEWRAWRAAFRRKLSDLMAPWPESCPLDPIVLERVPCAGYVREKVLFSSEDGMAVPAYILIPDAFDGSAALAAVICQHGHGNGKDDVVGLTHGTFGQWGLGQCLRYDYGVAMVQQGYVVMAMDARGFGERRLGYMIESGDDGCNITQIKAQLLGLNTLTLNVFDLSRCIDYLLTRGEVDPHRIGCAGLSYGGTLTLFGAALDERIKVAVVSGYLTSLYEQTFMRGDTCGQQIVPQLLRWGELSDVACLIAPRALLIESGTADQGFGIDAARDAYAHTQRLYDVLGLSQKIGQHIFSGGHRWDGARTNAWLKQWL